ncbi:MAG: hypothetical protein SPI77_09395 [Corynebacterium sp.]|nr:hypothetical protein [Corynebacterium sp.]
MRYLTLATAIAGISGFVVIIVAAWALGDSATMTADFTAYWGLFFVGTGILTGFMQETTRGVAAALQSAGPAAPELGPASPGTTGTRVWRIAAIIAAVIAVLLALTTPWFIGRIIETDRTIGAILLVIGLASYSLQAVFQGIVAGYSRWKTYAALVTLDSVSRMVLAALAWIMGWKLVAFLVVTVLGAASWAVIVAVDRSSRSAFVAARVDVTAREFARRAATAMAAAGANSVLIVGFPTLVKLTNPTAATAAAVIYAVTLTRAPILVPLMQFQSALIVRFVERRGGRVLAAPLGLVVGVGILGAGVAWLIGPWLIEVVLRSEIFAISGSLLAAYVLGATCMGALTVTGAAVLAGERHGAYLAGWLVAAVVAVVILAAVPLPLGPNAAVALVVGPLVGFGVHMAALR